MRAGVATTAANAGLPDRLFQIFDRWASSQSKDFYVKDALSKRLSVSEAILKPWVGYGHQAIRNFKMFC